MVVGGQRFYSVERPWKDNEPFESCIPEGQYRCEWRPTTTPVPNEYKGHTWYVIGGTVGFDSGDRTRIAWHLGNTAEDVQGCIAFGLRLGTVGGKWAVQRSREAMSQLVLPDEFDFQIVWGMAA